MKTRKILARFIQGSIFPVQAIIAVFLPTLLYLGDLNLLYAVIFFWILVAPSRILFSLIFALSLLQDLITHSYMGVHGSLYALFMIFLLSQRRQLLNRGFWLTWVAFAVSLLAVIALKSFTGFLLYHQGISWFEFVIEDIFPILLFPLVFHVCALLYARVFEDYA